MWFSIQWQLFVTTKIMKNLTLLLALATATAGFAQTNNNSKIPAEPIEQSKFSIGLTGGFGHSFVEPYENATFMPSWNAGITAVYAPGPHWGFGADVIYSGEGSKLKVGDITHSTQLDYLRIPLKAIYFFRKYEDDFRPKVSLGPTLGIMMDNHGNKNFNSFDVGANASIGFNYRLLRAVWFNADVSYFQGFTDIYSHNNETDLNGNIRLNVGLSFGF